MKKRKIITQVKNTREFTNRETPRLLVCRGAGLDESPCKKI